MNWDNKQEVLAKVKTKGWELEFASDRLKNDVEIIKIAVEDDLKNFKFAGDKIKKQFSTVKKFLKSINLKMEDC